MCLRLSSLKELRFDEAKRLDIGALSSKHTFNNIAFKDRIGCYKWKDAGESLEMVWSFAWFKSRE